jgi:heme exporter protein A
VGLSDYLDVLAQQLSAGQQRRVMLALLYLPQPLRCWVLDEPFTALDQAAVAQLEAHLNHHCAAGGAVLLTSHQLPLVWQHQTLDLSVGRSLA